MNYFPNNKEEKSLIEFIAKYQYLNVNDAKYFFSSKCYYQKRITNLVSKGLLRRSKLNLILGTTGLEYVKSFNIEYNKVNRNKKYLPRLLYLSNLGAFFYYSNTVKFIPSFSMKEKQAFTTIARRFIGIIEINGFEYLAYHISEKNDKKYLTNVIYDIQKEKTYKNIIILVDDLEKIDINDFSFGVNRVIILQDTEKNRESLKYLHSINWQKIIYEIYKEKVHISEYNFCDYTDNKNKYIATFYMFDTEKINRIRYFLRENQNKNIDIICSNELQNKLRKYLPKAHYNIIDFDKYIDKERNIYE